MASEDECGEGVCRHGSAVYWDDLSEWSDCAICYRSVVRYRAWQAFRDWLNGSVEQWQQYAEGMNDQQANSTVIAIGNLRAEVPRLTSELAAAREEVERLTKLAYGWKRKAEHLGKDRERLVLMNESLGDALDAARSAGGGA